MPVLRATPRTSSRSSPEPTTPRHERLHPLPVARLRACAAVARRRLALREPWHRASAVARRRHRAVGVPATGGHLSAARCPAESARLAQVAERGTDTEGAAGGLAVSAVVCHHLPA